jgi:hypothetical protein
MRMIERIAGKGTVSGDGGDPTPVQYDLQIFQEQIPARTMDAPNATIPGMKTIRGSVQPVCSDQSGLILEMKDGRKLKFFFKDSHGSIAVQSWIG